MAPIPLLTPACSTVTVPNVISVTSVVEVPNPDANVPSGLPVRRTRRRVCELRSSRYVSVGVLVNGPADRFGSFVTPHWSPAFRGTSFAAPYVTGLIARALAGRADLSSRQAVLRAIGAVRDLDLLDDIAGGLWIRPTSDEDDQ